MSHAFSFLCLVRMLSLIETDAAITSSFEFAHNCPFLFVGHIVVGISLRSTSPLVFSDRHKTGKVFYSKLNNFICYIFKNLNKNCTYCLCKNKKKLHNHYDKFFLIIKFNIAFAPKKKVDNGFSFLLGFLPGHFMHFIVFKFFIIRLFSMHISIIFFPYYFCSFFFSFSLLAHLGLG